MKIWLIYKVAMAFWINIHGCQPYPRHGPLKVNQLENDKLSLGTVCEQSHSSNKVYFNAQPEIKILNVI